MMMRDERKEMWFECIRRFRNGIETAKDKYETQGFSVSTLRFWLRIYPLDSPTYE